MNKKRKAAAGLVILVAAVFSFFTVKTKIFDVRREEKVTQDFEIPEYTGEASVEINGNVPYFSEREYPEKGEIIFSELDSLGRCGPAISCVGPENIPVEERGPIGDIKPSGWHLAKYEIIDDIYLYNRCHMIAFSLSGENANPNNLITGTRYLNKTGMLPYELKVLQYINNSGNHVVYRVTPIFNESELVCRGVLMEAYSLEDKGAGLAFNVFCFNVQPGIEINYATGESCEGPDYYDYLKVPESEPHQETETVDIQDADYVLNNNSMKFHKPDCDSVKAMSPKNRELFYGTRDEVIERGYVPCKACNP